MRWSGILVYGGYAYVSQYNINVIKCDVSPTTGLFSNCGASGAPVSGTNPTMIMYNNGYIYICQVQIGSTPGSVSKCTIGASGTLSW